MAAKVDAVTRCSSSVSSYLLRMTYTRIEFISLIKHWTGWTPEGFDSFPAYRHASENGPRGSDDDDAAKDGRSGASEPASELG